MCCCDYGGDIADYDDGINLDTNTGYADGDADADIVYVGGECDDNGGDGTYVDGGNDAGDGDVDVVGGYVDDG